MEHRFDTTGPVSADVRIPAGTIAVRVHADPTVRVLINGAKDPDDVAVTFDEGRDGSGRLVVEYRGKKVMGFLSIGRGLDVAIDVPHGSTLVATSGSADLEVAGSLDALTFRSGSGDLRFDDVDGDVVVKTASGDVHGGDVAGNARFHGASGDLTLGVVRRTLVARTASGNVRVEGIGHDAQITSVSGDVEIAGLVEGTSALRTVSGDVEVGITEGAGVYLDLASISGDVTCELEAASGPGSADESELTLDVSSVSGDVRVRRAAVHTDREGPSPTAAAQLVDQVADSIDAS